MSLTLAQVSFAISPGGSEHKLIDQIGLRGGAAASSTPSTCAWRYAFTSTGLELWWLDDETALPGEWQVAGLRQRLRWPETDASPFAIRLTQAAGTTPPFACEPLAVEPAGTLLATSSRSRLDEPLITLVPPQPAPPSAQRGLGLQDITHIELAQPGAPSECLQALAALGIVRLTRGDAHLTLVLDGGNNGRRIDLAPLIPIGFLV